MPATMAIAVFVALTAWSRASLPAWPFQPFYSHL